MLFFPGVILELVNLDNLCGTKGNFYCMDCITVQTKFKILTTHCRETFAQTHILM
jgi:hypothetical protein